MYGNADENHETVGMRQWSVCECRWVSGWDMNRVAKQMEMKKVFKLTAKNTSANVPLIGKWAGEDIL